MTKHFDIEDSPRASENAADLALEGMQQSLDRRAFEADPGIAGWLKVPPSAAKAIIHDEEFEP